eukprot:CAMPEP_0194153900 /NCGR_PEP_ID=MMETSP0152-20130528/58409_1 /TAXON_ID=1049557 /ORGANISM="Thalassiothrix antarctica, Strain L6-D1" /LENGTH=555 /DNA_ID=CAMNT_0038859585 /DNA_START=45 /DNA_END=1709 /DNA_ORIENTATION=-
MWRPPYERALPPHPPPPPPLSHQYGQSGPPHPPPPPHGGIRGYSNEVALYAHEIQYPPPHHGGDPYHHHHHRHHSRAIYRHPHPPPPPPPPRYEYAYGPPPPSAYTHRYRPPTPRSHYYGGGDGLPVGPEEMPVSAAAALSMIGGGCTCKKSKCLKLYCQCFSSSTTCGPKCKCQACHNTTLHREDIEEARKVILERNPSAFELKHYPSHPSAPTPPISPSKTGCKCRRSFCLKKYCECFNHGVKCNGTCRCVNCRNQADGAETTGTVGPYVQAQKPSPHRGVDDPKMPAVMASSEMTIANKISSQPSAIISGLTTVVENRSITSSMDKPPEDRMAIMAAVAMTELLGVGKRPRSRSPEKTNTETFLERSAKRQRTEELQQGGQHAIVSAASSDSSSPETIRKYSSRDDSPRGSPVSFTPYTGSYYRSSSITSYSPSQQHTAPLHQQCPKVYEEATRLSGLPKSLSFRKICSKCGKTRGEHGELGFGHRCVYQECGKCGAGVQMHVKAGVPMGILCSLTEKDGAIPGKARAYERKIQDLAIRAELQQKLQQQQRV